MVSYDEIRKAGTDSALPGLRRMRKGHASESSIASESRLLKSLAEFQPRIGAVSKANNCKGLVSTRQSNFTDWHKIQLGVAWLRRIHFVRERNGEGAENTAKTQYCFANFSSTFG
ncbi:hypothetical protein RJZ56_000974 [Blastomyces dermatitidis]